MSPFRYILQVCTFTFFAVWFLCLAVGKSLRLPELPQSAREWQMSPRVVPAVKPSPIDMLKRTAR